MTDLMQAITHVSWPWHGRRLWLCSLERCVALYAQCPGLAGALRRQLGHDRCLDNVRFGAPATSWCATARAGGGRLCVERTL